MMDFPVNRDGWSGAGRTKARWLKDTLDTPYSKAQAGDGDESATAYHRNGFLEVEVESAASTDYYMALTRDTFASDEIRAARKIATKWSGGQRAYWTQTASIPQPLADDGVARRYRSGLYSMGGNGAAFCIVPVSKENVFDRWGREVEYTKPPIFGGGTFTQSTPSVRRNMAIMMGSAGGDFTQVGPTFPVDSFSESNFTGTVPEFLSTGAFSSGYYVEGYDAESPAPPAVVEGAYFNGAFEAAVAFNTIDDSGDRVVCSRVFRADGSYVERVIAGAPYEAFSLRGFWRCGPGEYVACISHMYQEFYGKARNPKWDRDIGTRTWAGYAPMYTFIEQVMLPQAQLPMNFFVASYDGGRTWTTLPENDLLRDSNESAMAATAQNEIWNDLGMYETRSPMTVMSYAVHRASAVPVSPGKLFVTLLDSYSVPESSRGEYRNSRIIRGVLDIRSGSVESFAVIYDMPGLDAVGYETWLTEEPGFMFGGACLVPSGVAYMTMLKNAAYVDYMNAFPRLYRSYDGGASFTADSQVLPARWYVSREPQVLGDKLYQVSLNNIPYSSVYVYRNNAWSMVAAQTAPWRGNSIGSSLVDSSSYIYSVSGLNTNDSQLYNRLVRPFKNPTPSAPWVSDDRISYA